MTYPTQPGRSRTGTWVLLGCVGLVLLLMFLAVTGGVVYLVLERRGGAPPEPATPQAQTFSGDGFTLEYPLDWEQAELTPEDADAGAILQLRTAPRVVGDDQVVRDDFTVYRFTSEKRAVNECRFQAGFLSFLWDDPGTPEELEPTEIDGVVAAHHRVTGTDSSVDAIAETWCLDVDGEIVQIAAQSHGGHELVPEIPAILDSWKWAETAEADPADSAETGAE